MIRVLLADDHSVVRAGIARILAEAPDVEVVAQVADGHAVVERISGADVDVVVLDIGMPGPGFMHVLAAARHIAKPPAVLVLSVHTEDQFALRALKAGASGYLTKDRSPEELLAAVRRVAGGGRFVSASLAERLAESLGDPTLSAGHEALSDREFEVMRLLGSGKTVGDVARALSLSPKTVSTYRTRILQKLGLATTAELVRYAVEHGLIDR